MTNLPQNFKSVNVLTINMFSEAPRGQIKKVISFFYLIQFTLIFLSFILMVLRKFPSANCPPAK